MSITTTLSRYDQQNDSAENSLDDTQETDFTQIASCAVGRGDKPEQQSQGKSIQGHTGDSAGNSLTRKISKLFASQ